jgi:hypothetical protein
MSTSVLKSIYYASFHSSISYGIIIICENSSHSYTIFLLQKKAIRTMMASGNRVSCRNIFKQFHILPLASQYMFNILLQNKTLLPSNLQIFSLSSINLPQANQTIYQKRVHYAGIKIFNKLPIQINNTSNNLKKFNIALRHFFNYPLIA